MDNDKTMFYVVAIVAIVAVVGILVLVLGNRGGTEAVSVAQEKAAANSGGLAVAKNTAAQQTLAVSKDTGVVRTYANNHWRCADGTDCWSVFGTCCEARGSTTSGWIESSWN